MGVLIRNGGGNSKIKVDGIPPKKKMELSSIGNDEYLNFITIKNELEKAGVKVNNHTMERLTTFAKKDNYIYAIATYHTGTVAKPTYLIRYDLKKGWDKNFGIETKIDISSREYLTSIISISDDEILMSGYDSIIKINLKTGVIEDIISGKGIPKGEKAIFFKLENEIYLLADGYTTPQANYVYRIDVENKIITEVAYNGDKKFNNIFMHDNGVWINRGNQYCIFKDGAFTSIGELPGGSTTCIKINEKVHCFYLSTTNPVVHYILNKDGTWTQKEDLKKDEDLYINIYGLNTDIGYIQIDRNLDNAFMIITDELYLNKRRE